MNHKHYRRMLADSFPEEKKTKLDEIYNTKHHSIHNRYPHFIFSAENPLYSTKLKMSHDDVMDFLADRGYNAETVKGKYGSDETSILVHNPPKHAVKHLMKLAHGLGQESSIYSDGYNHEMHYHHGDNAGTHHKGQGTAFHKRPPEDYFSTLSDGTTFTHNFNFDEHHDRENSMVKQKPKDLTKSEKEGERSRPYLAKSEESRHILEDHNPDTKLIHYSPKQGLLELDPEKQGTGIKGTDFRQGKPIHPMSWFYLEGGEPEKEVVSPAKSKYITSLGHKKLYDVGKDPHGIKEQLREKAKNRQVNPGQFTREEFHSAIRNAGYHGIYNSQTQPRMQHVVGMFEKMPLEKELSIHAKDHDLTTTFDHHSHSERHRNARKFAKETGHHNPEFLASMKAKLGSDNG